MSGVNMCATDSDKEMFKSARKWAEMAMLPVDIT